jgi:hypothetical protein
MLCLRVIQHRIGNKCHNAEFHIFIVMLGVMWISIIAEAEQVALNKSNLQQTIQMQNTQT